MASLSRRRGVLKRGSKNNWRAVLLFSLVVIGAILRFSLIHAPSSTAIIPAAVLESINLLDASATKDPVAAAGDREANVNSSSISSRFNSKGSEVKAGNRETAKDPSTAATAAVRDREAPIADSSSKSNLFTPDSVKAGNLDKYVNLPVNPETDRTKVALAKALARPIDAPRGLRHKASPPGKDVVMGLAAYPKNMLGWTRVVGSIRSSGYDGHIIFGVHRDIPKDEEDYLREMDVTYYEVNMAECDGSILQGGLRGGQRGGGSGNSTNVRERCADGLEKLTLEWGRFEMCRQWLDACENCTGWAMVMDTRDIFFQGDPFASLPRPADEARENLLFVEEVGQHTSPKVEEHRWFDLGENGRYKGRTEPCYGYGHWRDFADRPVICSGTVLGTRTGMLRFLSVLVDEFYANNAKENPRCKSPYLTDQWTLNYMYYTGQFGEYARTRTMPWGTGPVMTIGKPCFNRRETPAHSQRDMIEFDEKEGYILNNYEEDGSGARVAPVVHQYDRCVKWMRPYFARHPEKFKDKPELAWKRKRRRQR